MPFKTTPEIDFSAVGLITDIPTHSLPDGAWNDCLNLRCKDGSVQGVNTFIDDILLDGLDVSGNPADANILNGKAMAVTQFTPAGYNYLILAFIVKGVNGKGSVVTYNTNTSLWNDITNSTATLEFTFNDRFPPQIFVFNEMLIVNPAVDAPPMFTDAGISSGSLNLIPNWLVDSSTKALVTRSLKPFGNRLMAMNILEEHDPLSAADDINLPVDILWSSHITGIGSLTNVEWAASTTNSAGDAFAVETPGRILDGGQLGEFFIAYKTDAVIRISETGDTYVLSFESIFEDDGLYSSRCFANIGDAQHLVVGNYGVYIHDGQSQKTDIAKGIFQDTIFDLVKAAEKDRAFCFQQTRDKEVWFCFSSLANTGLGCDLAFVYDYNEKKLHKRSLPGISDIFETELDGELAIYATKPDDNKLQVLSNTVYEADGFFVHEDDNLSDNTSIKWINGVYLDAVQSMKIALTATQSLTDAKVYTLKTFDPSNTYKVDFRTTGRYMNIKVQMDGSKNPQMGKLQFDVKLAGKR
jgi:hypothetical protein